MGEQVEKLFHLEPKHSPGVKFRRQHWLFLLICLLMFIIVLSIYLPIASRASSLEDPDYRMRVIGQLLRETPLIDGWVECHSSLSMTLSSSRHNDLPWNIRQFVHNKIKTVNFSSDLSQVDNTSVVSSFAKTPLGLPLGFLKVVPH